MPARRDRASGEPMPTKSPATDSIIAESMIKAGFNGAWPARPTLRPTARSEGWLKYQAVDPAVLTPDELAMWHGYFEEARHRAECSPKVGLMKLRPVPGEQIRRGALRRVRATRHVPRF